MKTLSVCTACYNEEGNVEELYERVRDAIALLGSYRYEHIFIDNCSRDNTLAVLKRIAARDKNVKIIENSRNFGPVRSPMYGIQQGSGDAVIGLSADLQDPPELIVDMVREWERGTPIVIAVKKTSDEHGLMFWLRSQYYKLINRLSDVDPFEHFTGFGLYDRRVMDLVKRFNDPYFRGVIADIGLPHAEIAFNQPERKWGVSNINIYALYDLAMLGITSLSKVPLRLVTFSGFIGAFLCVLVSLAYFIYKLIFWNRFSLGVAPLVIGVFFFMSLQMLFMGIVGEYIGTIHSMVQNRPLVVEEERINFEYGPGEPLSARTVLAHEAPGSRSS
jgi:glycosyltransferase involved in cell wall biosynthesis